MKIKGRNRKTAKLRKIRGEMKKKIRGTRVLNDFPSWLKTVQRFKNE
jgi:hypothetical protein